MENNVTDNKTFVLKIALLYICLLISVWISKDHDTTSSLFNYISKANVVEAAPMLVQMLNKWYFIGF
jgi:hypothetical protein